MNTQISSSFIKAAEHVLNEIGFPGITTKMLDSTELATQQDSEILAMVGIVGEIKGHLILHFPVNGSTPFVSHLSDLLGMHEENTDDLHFRKAALAEIANQISGSATAFLAESGIDCLVTPPMVLSGTCVSTVLPEADQKFAFEVQGEFGNFSCILAIKNTRII